MRRNRKFWVAVIAFALLLSSVIVWLTWSHRPQDKPHEAARCSAVTEAMDLSPALTCAGFHPLPTSAAFGWLKDAQNQKAEFWGDAAGRKVAVSDFSDGVEESDGTSHYVGVSLPTAPALWCSLNGQERALSSLLAKAADVQHTVVTGAAIVDPASGEVTSEREFACFVESPSLD